MIILAPMICFGFSAWNIVLYAEHGQGISLFAGIFCALCGIASSIIIARSY